MVLFAGGAGRIGIEDDGTIRRDGNFLVRTRASFAARGFLVAVVDAPDDRRTLLDWRTDRVTPAEDRALGARIGAIRSEEMDKAAGQLLLDRSATPAQRQGLAAILASSSSDLAIGYLFAAGRDPDLCPEAAEGLATVSEPGALPALAAGIDRETAPELLRATLSALRNIDTPKARDLEARVRALLAGR